MMSLEEYRKKIDKINIAILKLLNNRAQLTLEIGELKRKNQISVHNANRESKIIDQMLAANTGPLSSDAIKRIFVTIIEECRNLQYDNNLTETEEKDGHRNGRSCV